MIKKIFKSKTTDESQSQLAITNSTIAKQRREILEKGKKFKYPVQYGKHKLVINTIIIAIFIVIVSVIFGWHQFYVAQNTGTFAYRISLVFPIHVANVDGEGVLYSDYLAQYRSNMTITERQEEVLDGARDKQARSDFYKKQSMDVAIANAYAIKLARQFGIKVSDEEINKIYAEQRKTQDSELSEAAFNKIIEDNYQLSPQEHRRMFIELPLLRQKVAVKVDEKAKRIKDEVSAILSENGGDFSKIAEKFGDKVEVGAPGFVRSTNIDGGRTKTALNLNKGQVSKPFVSESGDCYYIVKLVEKRGNEVSYEYIKINLTEFSSNLDQLKSAGKVKEYIKVR